HKHGPSVRPAAPGPVRSGPGAGAPPPDASRRRRAPRLRRWRSPSSHPARPGLPRTEATASADRGARLGLLGGTFDPPHTGHLVAAETCRGVLALDRVLLVVANDPWQKSPRRT